MFYLLFELLLCHFRLIKRVMTFFKNKHNYCTRPNIYSLCICIIPNNLRSHIQWCSTFADSCRRSKLYFSSEPKISYFQSFQFLFILDQNIFWFYVSMKYTFWMNIVNSIEYTIHDLCCLLICKGTFLLLSLLYKLS